MFLVTASEYNYMVGSLKCCAFRSRTVLLLCSVVIEAEIWFEIGTTSSYNTDIWITFLLYKRYVTKALDILTSLEIIV